MPAGRAVHLNVVAQPANLGSVGPFATEAWTTMPMTGRMRELRVVTPAQGGEVAYTVLLNGEIIYEGQRPIAGEDKAYIEMPVQQGDQLAVIAWNYSQTSQFRLSVHADVYDDSPSRMWEPPFLPTEQVTGLYAGPVVEQGPWMPPDRRVHVATELEPAQGVDMKTVIFLIGLVLFAMYVAFKIAELAQNANRRAEAQAAR